MLSSTKLQCAPKIRRLINKIEESPKDSLQGITLLYPHIRFLNIGNTLVRKDYQYEQCPKLLSGGPTGYEPMYSGYIGNGMLTAAIQGNLYQPPSTYEIYNVIKELTFRSSDGVLVIIPNSSVALNFTLAIQKAISEGNFVKLIVVTDDCCNPRNFNKSGKADGLTGTLILQKIAGSMIDGFKKNLMDVYEICCSLQKDLYTVLINLQSPSVLENFECSCKRPQGVQLGGGLHGERGATFLDTYETGPIITEALAKLHSKFRFTADVPVIILINNMCCSVLEENIVTCELLKKLLFLNIKVERVYVGTFMTSVDMQGFTITALKSDENVLQYLDHPTEAPCWKMKTFGVDMEIHQAIDPRIRLMSYPRIPLMGPKLTAHHSNTLLLVMQFSCDALISCRKQLDIIDSEFGDGDTGSRLAEVAKLILEGLETKQINLEYPFAFFKMLSKICDRINGCLGAIYSVCFESCANTFAQLNNEHVIDENVWFTCLRNIIDDIKKFTQTGENGNNMLTPLVACCLEADRKLQTMEENAPILDAFEAGVSAAEEAAIGTILSGRKHPDPGAHSVGIWLRAAFEGVKFRYIYPK